MGLAVEMGIGSREEEEGAFTSQGRGVGGYGWRCEGNEGRCVGTGSGGGVLRK